MKNSVLQPSVIKKKVYTQKELDALKAKAYTSNQAYIKMLHNNRIGTQQYNVEATKIFSPLVEQKTKEEKEKKLENRLNVISTEVKKLLFTNNSSALVKLEELQRDFSEENLQNLAPYQELQKQIGLGKDFLSGIYDQVHTNNDRLYGLSFEHSTEEGEESRFNKEFIIANGESHMRMCFFISKEILGEITNTQRGTTPLNYFIIINASEAGKVCFEVRKSINGGVFSVQTQVDFNPDLLRVLTENITIESQRDNYYNLFNACCQEYYMKLIEKDEHERTDTLEKFDEMHREYLKYRLWIKPLIQKYFKGIIRKQKEKLQEKIGSSEHPMKLRSEEERKQTEFYSPTEEEKREKKLKKERRETMYQTPLASDSDSETKHKKEDLLTMSPEGEKIIAEKQTTSLALDAPLKKEELEIEIKQEAKKGNKEAQRLVERLTPMGQKPFDEYYNNLQEPRPNKEEALTQWKKTLNNRHKAIYFKAGTLGQGNVITISPNDNEKLKRLFVLIGTKKAGNTADTLHEFSAILDTLFHDKKIDVTKYKSYLRKLYHE